MALSAWRAIKDFTTASQVENFLTKSTGSVSYPQFAAEVY
jgi:hypothetical protein